MSRQIENFKLFESHHFCKGETVCKHFCQLRKLHLDPFLFLDGEPDPVVKEHKFLGLIFDHKLNFIPHIKYLYAKKHDSRSFHIMTGVQTVRFYSDYTELWSGPSWIMVQLYVAQLHKNSRSNT